MIILLKSSGVYLRLIGVLRDPKFYFFSTLGVPIRYRVLNDKDPTNVDDIR